MGDDEQARILRMVAEGTITPAEAGDLLSALEHQRHASPPAPPPSVATVVKPGNKRHLSIEIIEGDNTKVNVRIPLALARAAGRFIPRQAQAYLEEREISIEAIMEGMQAEDGENTLLEIHEGDSFVRIAVE